MMARYIVAGLRLALVISLVLSQSPASAQSSTAFDRGMDEFRAGHYASAAALFAEADSSNPGATDALLYRAKSLVNLQEFTDAEKSLRTYIGSHANSSDALYLLGFVLNRENRAAESLSFYTRAAAIAKPTSDDLKIVGLDYILLNDYSDGIKWLERSVVFDSANKDAWYFLGRAYYTKARLEDAHRAFQKVLNLDPRNVRAEDNIGLIYETSGDTAAAIAAYRQAISWQTDNLQPNEQPYVNLGNLLMEQGETEEALGLLEKAVAIAPKNAYCHLTLGEYYRKTGRLKDAQRELQQATELDPENSVAHYQLGRAYKDMHEVARAQVEFKRAADLKTQQAGLNSDKSHP